MWISIALAVLGLFLPARSSATSQSGSLNGAAGNVSGTMTAGFFSGDGHELTHLSTSSYSPVLCNLPSVSLGASCSEPSNVTGNAATVSNGLYSTGSYPNPSWLTSVSSGIVSGLSASSVAYASNAGGAPPTGVCSGDLGGTFPACTVAHTQAGSVNFSTITAAYQQNISTQSAADWAAWQTNISTQAAVKSSTGTCPTGSVAQTLASDYVGCVSTIINAWAVPAAGLGPGTISNNTSGTASNITGNLSILQINLSTVPVGGLCSGAQIMTGHAAGSLPSCEVIPTQEVSTNTITGVLPVAKGGTGASSANAALTALGAQPAGSYIVASATVATLGSAVSGNISGSAAGLAGTPSITVATITANDIGTGSLTASSGTFTSSGNSQYSVNASSGVKLTAGLLNVTSQAGSLCASFDSQGNLYGTGSACGSGSGGLSSVAIGTAASAGANTIGVVTSTGTLGFDTRYMSVSTNGIVSISTNGPGIAPTRTILLSGSGTYTTPSGAVQLLLRMVGGGGGGSGATGTGGSPAPGSNGTSSYFGVFLSSFGSAGTYYGAQGGTGGGVSSTTVSNVSCVAYIGGDGGAGGLVDSSTMGIGGGSGGNSVYGGGGSGGGGNTQQYGNIGKPGTGGGGGGGAANTSSGYSGSGGGAGGYLECLISNPSASYSYSVGQGGYGGVGGTTAGQGNTGGSGSIQIIESYAPVTFGAQTNSTSTWTAAQTHLASVEISTGGVLNVDGGAGLYVGSGSIAHLGVYVSTQSCPSSYIAIAACAPGYYAISGGCNTNGAATIDTNESALVTGANQGCSGGGTIPNAGLGQTLPNAFTCYYSAATSTVVSEVVCARIAN